MEFIRIRGARTHNLQNIDLDIPRNRLVVVTGRSGSGKSSLAFDTVYAEGQRRYAESVTAYARRAMQLEAKPDIDSIDGLTPTVAVSQAAVAGSARSTVGTLSEISDYMRVLFAKAGTAYCPKHHRKLTRSGIHDMVDVTLRHPEGTRALILAPLGTLSAEAFSFMKDEMEHAGFQRLRVNGEVCPIEEIVSGSFAFPATVEVVVDRLKISEKTRGRLAESFETATHVGKGRAQLCILETGKTETWSLHCECPECGYTVPDFSPAMFSFNNPLGACPHCEGLGELDAFDPEIIVRSPQSSLRSGALCGWSSEHQRHFDALMRYAPLVGLDLDAPWEDLPENLRERVLFGDPENQFEGVIPELDRLWEKDRNSTRRIGLSSMRSLHVCPHCHGSRLREDVANVYIGEGPGRVNIIDCNAMSLECLFECLQNLRWNPQNEAIARAPLLATCKRLSYLVDVGLGYLTLERTVRTLSGGEIQRIRLAGQLGSGLTSMTYVLDEPTIGLHPRDTRKLIELMRRLVDAGNTLIVVEHDQSVIESADWIIELGPGAGERGGSVIACGKPSDVLNPSQARHLKLPTPAKRRALEADLAAREQLSIVRAQGHNLKDLTCHFPVGAMTVVTGVSGSGKSSLILDTLASAMRRRLHRSHDHELPYGDLCGIECFDKVIIVDQGSIGKSERANMATYTRLWGLIREVFAQTPAALERGYDVGRFSFNRPGGRCEACQGTGERTIEMGILPAVTVRCQTCQGKRFNRETLEVKYRGKSVHDVLEMTVTQALEFFEAHPQIVRRLETLRDVGLGYMRLGQSTSTFSGGEAQRIRLADELARPTTGRTLYVLDEPTTGLNHADVQELLDALRILTGLGNTVVVIEHQLEVMAQADWIIDIGPEGGEKGGTLVVEGTPWQVSQCKRGFTGRYLKDFFSKQALAGSGRNEDVPTALETGEFCEIRKIRRGKSPAV